MTIDVEDWFHVENLRRAIPRDTWRARALRVESSMDRMLELMEPWNVKATCFVLGCVADRVPDLVRRIAANGHEVASHGYGHDLVYDLEPARFRGDVRQSKELLEEITGQEVVGYRAPSFSLTDWALPILAELGFEYDSSLFPTTVAHRRYGKLPSVEVDRHPIVRLGRITEVPLSCLPLGTRALPWAGGGYFRLIPYRVFKVGVNRILDSGKLYIFYIHPWEIDTTQPRVDGLRRSERFRHYLNIEKTEARWVSLMRDFAWLPIAKLLAEDREGAEASTAGGGQRG